MYISEITIRPGAHPAELIELMTVLQTIDPACQIDIKPGSPPILEIISTVDVYARSGVHALDLAHIAMFIR